jgi:dTDP-4-amino-4,6-dideoxygalactose transaminase
MIRLARPLLDDAEVEAVAAVLRSGRLVQGPRVAEFEALLAAVIGVPHAVACTSGTTALHLALLALEPAPRTPVLVPAFTFPATASAVLNAGLEPILVDVDPSTYNFDPDDALGQLDAIDGPAIFLPVHQFGLPSALDLLMGPCRDRGVPVVEDAACALGASLSIDGETVATGAVGDLGCFSFHPRKVITTGEGGLVTTCDPELDKRLRLLRNHGMTRTPNGIVFDSVGHNFRLSEMQAAIGIVQMGRLEHLQNDRNRIARGYDERLQDLRERGLELPRVPDGVVPSWQSYVVRVPEDVDRDALLAQLRADGIECSVGAHSLQVQPAYRGLPGFARPMPGADDCRRRALCLPVATGLTESELDRVGEALRTRLWG